ncbi:MAG: bifunctional UDP-N-acetylglucosamine diphosphorylase/glucosamine-1-phosphate N-acetyltransferase GlmU [Pseudomonadota bacterium]|nr:bifunctional UDP-N-acetylglucosamine diphosphorylase/glucosamine-1-phosphate N-acetyltransferase GlmU [Pseudomonadota bacterium]
MDQVAAMILAAGKGTRMKSAVSKMLHPLLGLPMLSYPLRALKKLEIGRQVVVIGSSGQEVMDGFSDWSGVSFAWQREQRGTADAAAMALTELEDFSGNILIVCGDVPLLKAGTLEELLLKHRQTKAVVSVLSAVLPNGGAYGRLVLDAAGELVKIVEARDASPAELEICRINSGIYCVDADFLRQALAGIGCANAQGEYYLTDMVAEAFQVGKKVMFSDVADPDEIMGINDREQLSNAEMLLAARIRRQWQGDGVTISFPEQVVIEPDVHIGMDTTIEKGVSLKGKTVIGAGCYIGEGVILQDVHLGDRVRVLPYSVLEQAVVEADAQVGPFAHLRPGSLLREKAKIGNFVEVKKAEIGIGSKASHLSYIGDATIGNGVNIGAGTITCNYDGFDKHRTIIEDGVFVGSDSQFVAPVRIGKNALVGAGSTVTKNVPENAVVTSRNRQTIYPDRGMASRTVTREE